MPKYVARDFSVLVLEQTRRLHSVKVEEQGDALWRLKDTQCTSATPDFISLPFQNLIICFQVLSQEQQVVLVEAINQVPFRKVTLNLTEIWSLNIYSVFSYSKQKLYFRLVRERGGMEQQDKATSGFGDSVTSRYCEKHHLMQFCVWSLKLEAYIFIWSLKHLCTHICVCAQLFSIQGGRLWLGPWLPLGGSGAQMCFPLLWCTTQFNYTFVGNVASLSKLTLFLTQSPFPGIGYAWEDVRCNYSYLALCQTDYN